MQVIWRARGDVFQRERPSVMHAEDRASDNGAVFKTGVKQPILVVYEVAEADGPHSRYLRGDVTDRHEAECKTYLQVACQKQPNTA
eukprot:245862-Rhodomonas_salina.1